MTSIPGLRGIPSMPTSQDAAGTLRWRRHQLMAAGLDELSAHRLAVGADVDIHAVLTLKDADSVRLLEPGPLGGLGALNQDSPDV